jgi:hypothetical protein
MFGCPATQLALLLLFALASPARALAAAAAAADCTAPLAGTDFNGHDGPGEAEATVARALRVIPDCHFAEPLNHFMPGFLSNSVAIFRK